jgi:hypothetical protein
MTLRLDGVGLLGPWFRHRRRLAIAVAGALAAAICVAGSAQPGDRVALSAVFGLPIALVAVTFGTNGGVTAGVGVLALVGVWAGLASSPGVGAGAWAAGTAMLVLGALLGQAVDSLVTSEERARQVEEARRRLARAADRRREAAEINDTLVQSAAVAKWALEAGNVQRALEILDETVDAGQRLVTALINDVA